MQIFITLHNNSIFIILFLILFINLSFGKHKSNLVVIVNSNDLNENHITVLESWLINGMIKTNKYNVIERRELKTIFLEKEFKLTNFVSNNQINEIGGIIGADEILYCNIIDLDENYNINCRLSSVISAEILSSVNTLSKKNINDILNKTDDIIYELIGEKYFSNLSNNNLLPIRKFKLNNLNNIDLNTKIVVETKSEAII